MAFTVNFKSHQKSNGRTWALKGRQRPGLYKDKDAGRLAAGAADQTGHRNAAPSSANKEHCFYKHKVFPPITNLGALKTLHSMLKRCVGHWQHRLCDLKAVLR